MKQTFKTLAVVSLVVLGAVALAQGGGGRGQGGRGMMGRGGGSAASLVNRPEVQAEIKLTDEQKAKLEAYATKAREERAAARQAGGGGGGGGGFDREAMMKAMAERNASEEKAIKEIITPEQWKRVWEIWVQNQGNRAILNEQVQKDLGLSDDQKAQIKKLQDQQMEAMAAMREQQMDRDQMMEAMQKQQKTMNDELGKVLNTDQTAALKAMGGKEFKLTQGGGGGGL